jgi:aspartokinase
MESIMMWDYRLIKKHFDLGFRPTIVCSAMGKTTNSLLSAGDFALTSGQVYIDSLRTLHITTAQTLGLTDNTIDQLNALLDEVTRLLEGILCYAMLSDAMLSDAMQCYAMQFNQTCANLHVVSFPPVSFLVSLVRQNVVVVTDSLTVRLYVATHLIQHPLLPSPLVGIKYIGELSPRTQDALVSFGERMSVRILAGLLNKLGVPAQAFDSWNIGMTTSSEFGNAEVRGALRDGGVSCTIRLSLTTHVVSMILYAFLHHAALIDGFAYSTPSTQLLGTYIL